jgi:hypothetical protein
VARRRRIGVHRLFRPRPVPLLRPRHRAGEGRLFRPQGRGRGQPFPGAGNRAVGNGRPRQHRRCRGCRRHRRSGRHLLDDPRRPDGHGVEIHRMHARREIPQRIRRRHRLRRPDVLHVEGLQGTRPSRRQDPGGDVLRLLHPRRARRRQHVPGQPGPRPDRRHRRRLPGLDHRASSSPPSSSP